MEAPVPTGYPLGYSEGELDRLIEQSAFVGDLTEDLFRRAGLRPGMKVLDIGCGAGDVSLLALKLVGATGSVLGIDRDPDSIDRARARARQAQISNVAFETAELHEFQSAPDFDAIVSRLVLLYLQDAAKVLKSLARTLKPGGLVVSQEMEMSMVRLVPAMPLHQACANWIVATFRRSGVETDMGSKLHGVYRQADLPEPQMILAGRAEAGPHSRSYVHWERTIRSLLPRIEQFGIATASEIDVDTLADRLRAESVACAGVKFQMIMVGAWAKIPEAS